MQTVVLAAGQGTRMRPLTATRPKPMLPVAGHPLVAHILDAAVTAGATRLILVVGYEAESVRSHFGSSYRGIPIEYAIQSEQRGTADAVQAAQSHLTSDPFVVLAGDNLYDADSLAGLYESAPAVGAYEVENPRPYGVFELDNGQVIDVIEKPDSPPSKKVNVSAYAFEKKAQDWLDVSESERGEYELTEVLAQQIAEGAVRVVPIDRWLDVGRPWELLAANEWIVGDQSRSIDGDIHEQATLIGDVVVESNATIRSGVTIEGPAWIGPESTIGPNAYIRGTSAIGPNAHVGHAVEIKNSVLMAGATVGHLSYVGDSILGRDVNFGAGTTVANLRHDDSPVSLTVKGDRVSTGRRKFGVVVGDGVKTGIDTALNPGVTLSTGARTDPGEVITRDR